MKCEYVYSPEIRSVIAVEVSIISKAKESKTSEEQSCEVILTFLSGPEGQTVNKSYQEVLHSLCDAVSS